MSMEFEYWNDIVGQESIKSILNRILESEKIPHAILFKGNNGVGKEYIAVKFLKAINKINSNTAAQGHIQRHIINFSEPFIKYIFPLPRGKNENDTSGPFEKLSLDENDLIQNELRKKIKNPYYNIQIPKANQIKISSIRDIKKFLSMDFSDLKYRLVLISSAHLMNEEAQNALLKNLEEPPEGVIFILTTAHPEQLRETIKSRCWPVSFQPLNTNDIVKILISHFDVDEETASGIAPFSGGSVNNAINLLQYDLSQLKEKTILILRYAFGRRFNSAMDIFNSVTAEQGSDAYKILILMIVSWLNDLQKFRAGLANFNFNDYVETFQKFNLRFSDVELNEIVFRLDRFASLIQNNINLSILSINIITELSLLTQN
jgi:DNA polymerase III subunit delta'